MNYEFKLALKYFRARRKSLARFTAILAVVGITAGVASLIVAQGLARGFQSEMQHKILANTSHITLYKNDGAEIKNWQTLVESLKKLENVRQAAPTSYENALIVNQGITGYAVLRVVGKEKTETKTEAAFRNPHSAITIAVGAELAEKTNLKIGDEAEIIIPTSQNEFAPKTAKVVVGDVFRTGLFDYDSTWIYISLESLAAIAQRPNFAPSVLSISVSDVYRANETAAKLREILPPDFKIIDWQEANQPLFAALSLEKKVALAIISLIIFIAALNITTTLALLVNERRFDIAILRVCGAQTKSLLAIFFIEGLFLGFGGLLFGLILGLLICFTGNYFKIISLPTEVYSLNYVPLIPNLNDVLIIVGTTFFLILLATIYPAWKAAKIKPLENLRNQ